MFAVSQFGIKLLRFRCFMDNKRGCSKDKFVKVTITCFK